MATQAVSTDELLIKLDSDLLAQLKASAAKFGYESSDQVGAEIIERYLGDWLASKEVEPNGAEPLAPRRGSINLYEQSIAEMMADPHLTEAEKQELLRQLELPDDEWEPIQLPEGVEPISETIIKMRREGGRRWPGTETSVQADDLSDLQALHAQCVAQMLADPHLTDEEKQRLLRELEMSDEEWQPIELPEGAEPVSVTLIKMRRGEEG